MRGGVDPFQAWDAARGAVEAWAGQPVAVVLVRRRGPGRYVDNAGAELRRLAVYLACCGLGCPPWRLQEACMISAPTMGVFLRQVEDRRDAPDQEELISRLELDARARFEGLRPAA